MFSVLEKSYLNISGNIYDADFISLARVDDHKINFDDRTLFLTDKQKQELNSQEVIAFDHAVYITRYKGIYSFVCDLDNSWYKKGNIKIHELVLPDTVQGMLSNYYDYNAESSQVTIVHEETIDYEAMLYIREADYVLELDDIEVRVYTKENADALLKYVNQLDEVFIADGHHRIYSTSLSDIKKSNSVSLMCLEDISILSIDRVLPNISKAQFDNAMDMLRKHNMLVESSNLEKGIVRMTYANETYYIKLRELESNAFKNNDIYRLNTQVISLAFRVFDTNALNYYVDQDDTAEYMKNNLNAVSFEAYPIDFKEFLEIVKKGQIMPPKSTFFYPKFPSFLIFKKY